MARLVFQRKQLGLFPSALCKEATVSNDNRVPGVDFVAKEAALAAGISLSVSGHFPVSENILPLKDGQPGDLTVHASFKPHPCPAIHRGKLIGALRHDGE